MQVALEGTPRQAKFASRFIANSKHKEACSELIEVSQNSLHPKLGLMLLRVS